MARTILMPIDLSDEASWRKSLAEALTLLREGGALHVVTVLPDFGLAQVSGYFGKDFERNALHEMGEALDRLGQRECARPYRGAPACPARKDL
jgi:nucleotide-binding universal stress UspA family protein